LLTRIETDFKEVEDSVLWTWLYDERFNLKQLLFLFKM